MHILVVKDNEHYRENVIASLQKKFTNIDSIRIAASVDEAIEQIESKSPLDLLVTDTLIRYGSCVDVLCHVSESSYHVVYMSSDEWDYRVQAMKEARFGFYLKLDDIQKLITRIIEEMRNLHSVTVYRIKKLKQIVNSGWGN